MVVITNKTIEAIKSAASLLRDKQITVTDADGWHLLQDAISYLWHRHARAQLFEAGFCESPNASIAGPGIYWYAMGPGIKEPAEWNQEVRLCEDQCGIVELGHTGEPYTKTFCHTWKWVLSPRTVPEVVDWLEANGKLSEPGLPAWAQGID